MPNLLEKNPKYKYKQWDTLFVKCTMNNYKLDIEVFRENLKSLPKIWEGKKCVLELKEADFNWRQMEWWAFYFEYIVQKKLAGKMKRPGDRYGNVQFDLKGAVNWDLKASAIKTNNHMIILNDKVAMDKSIKQHGCHGEIIALCDVEYNDCDRSFQRWHTWLKGGKSKYEKERENRTSVSRYRKTRAELAEILFLILKENDVGLLSIMKQGRNSDGSPRKIKYMLDLENIQHFEMYKIDY